MLCLMKQQSKDAREQRNNRRVLLLFRNYCFVSVKVSSSKSEACLILSHSFDLI